jgi:transposase-like protein
MAIIPLHCPHCQGTDLSRFGKTSLGKQRYACNNPECPHRTFTLEPHTYRGRRQEVKGKILEMAMNGSGVRETARVLGISTSTVIKELKKRRSWENINRQIFEKLEDSNI